jgi:enoyl reductase-like protein
MTQVSRSDIYPRSESGGEVFQELERLLSDQSKTATPIQDLLNVINNKRSENVSDVVARYREETGLGLVQSENETTIKTAAFEEKEVKSKFLSKRHKIASSHPVLSNADACKDIESFCSCSGGHKSLHAIIHALREKLGREDLSYTDPELIKFIEDCQAKHKETCSDGLRNFEAGQVGTHQESHDEDQIADYFKSGR